MCKQEETEQPSNIPSKIRSRRCMVVRDNKSGNIISAQLEEATEESSAIASLDPLEQLIFEEIARKKEAETKK